MLCYNTHVSHTGARLAVLFITSDRPGAGKTALASSLAARWSQAGKRVGYFKPLSLNPRDDADVSFVTRDVLSDGAVESPIAMPEDVRAALPKDISRGLKQSLDALERDRDVVLVEGPGLLSLEGESSPIAPELAEELDARVLLILRYAPGLEDGWALEACGAFGERLAGVLINSVTQYKEREARSNLTTALESKGIKFLGALPEDRLLMGVTVGQLATHLDGRWVTGQERAQSLLERFLIGGNVMDWGVNYFGRFENQAVIVRGDRPDIHMSALSTATACLVLTGGHDPIQYVYHQAEQLEVPLLVVESDTLTTAQALENVLDHSTIHHPAKVERFQELVRAKADLEAIDAAI